jgi:hypothetical protein
MSRFFFHVREGERLVRDEEGSECPDLAAAREEAKASARDLAKQYLDDRTAPDPLCVEICDAAGRVLTVLPMAELLDNPAAPAFHEHCPPRA